MLTRKQYDLLIFIESYIAEHDIGPTYDEMKTSMGLRSKSGIVRLVDALGGRGYIKRRYRCARSIEVLQSVGSFFGIRPELAELVRAKAEDENLKPETVINEAVARYFYGEPQ